MFKKLLCAATLIAATTAANASPLTASYSIVKESTPVATTVDVAKFDDMAGTLILESVMIEFTGTIETEITLINPDPIKAQNGIGYNVSGTVSLDDGTNTALVSLPSISGTIDLPAGGSASTPTLSNSDMVSATYTDAPTLAMFTGVDMLTLDFNADASSTFTGTGNVFNQVLTSAYGNVVVSYTFKTVPVSAPAHLALLGLGLVAFAGFRKARG